MRPPNILLIMSDQHHAGFMGSAGHRLAVTPHLDALARSGARFTQAYTPCPLCTPARMAFLTGQAPGEISCRLLADALSSDTPTFAHGLTAAGYETVLCGKMHFAGPDQFHGFAHRPMSDPAGKMLFPPEIYNAGRGIWSGAGAYPLEVAGYGFQGFQHYDRAVTRHAGEFLRSRKPGDPPFAIVAGYVSPHNPFVCEKRWFDHYDALVPELPAFTAEDEARLPRPILEMRTQEHIADVPMSQQRRALVAYLGLVSELDEQIGALLEALGPEAANTVVIYCSDHGEMASEHGLWFKRVFYEASTRVPLIISHPGHIPAGRTVAQPVTLLDLAPTLLEIGGAPPLPRTDGQSLAPLLRGEEATRTRDIWSEDAGSAGSQPWAMLRRGRWKHVHFHASESDDLLFDMERDPGEFQNLAGAPACTSVLGELRDKVTGSWDGDRVVQETARSRAAHAFIKASGLYDRLPGLPPPVTGEGLPPFDLSQLFQREENLSSGEIRHV